MTSVANQVAGILHGEEVFASGQRAWIHLAQPDLQFVVQRVARFLVLKQRILRHDFAVVHGSLQFIPYCSASNCNSGLLAILATPSHTAIGVKSIAHHRLTVAHYIGDISHHVERHLGKVDAGVEDVRLDGTGGFEDFDDLHDAAAAFTQSLLAQSQKRGTIGVQLGLLAHESVHLFRTHVHQFKTGFGSQFFHLGVGIQVTP